MKKKSSNRITCRESFSVPYFVALNSEVISSLTLCNCTQECLSGDGFPLVWLVRIQEFTVCTAYYLNI